MWKPYWLAQHTPGVMAAMVYLLLHAGITQEHFYCLFNHLLMQSLKALICFFFPFCHILTEVLVLS